MYLYWQKFESAYNLDLHKSQQKWLTCDILIFERIEWFWILKKKFWRINWSTSTVIMESALAWLRLIWIEFDCIAIFRLWLELGLRLKLNKSGLKIYPRPMVTSSWMFKCLVLVTYILYLHYVLTIYDRFGQYSTVQHNVVQ